MSGFDPFQTQEPIWGSPAAQPIKMVEKPPHAGDTGNLDGSPFDPRPRNHRIRTIFNEKMESATAVNQLEQLKKFTKVVADTGDFEAIREFEPLDATTNPTLILKAAQKEEYRHLVEKAVADRKGSGLSGDKLVAEILDDVLILFGIEILKIVPGRVSTETDAKLSFDVDGLLEKSRKFIRMYEEKGISRERVLIKIATTWEGVKAAEVLQKEGINCNMTLLFSMAQAIACAEANAKLISPFVGRILDWHKAKTGKDYQGAEDPGVQSVTSIYNYYKKFGYQTEVMGASFRNVGEILELAGSDLLTISPNLLAELKGSDAPVERKLDAAAAASLDIQKVEMNEPTYRWMFNEDAMATEKTAEGIRNFAADTIKLEKLIAEML